MSGDRTLRSFQFDGTTYRLADDPAVRDADLAGGSITLLRQSDGSTRAIHARDLNIPAPRAEEPVGDDRLYNLRELLENALALDFTDDEIIEMIEIARRHRLLRVPGGAA